MLGSDGTLFNNESIDGSVVTATVEHAALLRCQSGKKDSAEGRSAAITRRRGSQSRPSLSLERSGKSLQLLVCAFKGQQAEQ